MEYGLVLCFAALFFVSVVSTAEKALNDVKPFIACEFRAIAMEIVKSMLRE